MTDKMTVKEALAVVIVAANEEAETCDVQFAKRLKEKSNYCICGYCFEIPKHLKCTWNFEELEENEND